MGNAAAEHLRVRQAITQVLFTLMEKKAFSEITVSEIISAARVARASFYRNFDSKEAVIDHFLEELHGQIMQSAARNSAGRPASRQDFVRTIEHVLAILLTQKKPLLALYRNGFGDRLQNSADIYIEELAGDMHHNSANKYLLYCFSGASMNMLIHWLHDGTAESIQDLAQVCADFFLQAFQLYRPTPSAEPDRPARQE